MTDDYSAIERTIRNRRTSKVLANPEQPSFVDPIVAEQMDTIVLEAISAAGWAPFHYDRRHNDIAEPWRCHLLRHQACRNLAAKFSDWFGDVKPNNKSPNMLAACGALVLVTWLPQNDAEGDVERLRTINEEHLAAAAAFVQNLLLLLTARGMATYWSSGGLLRGPNAFQKLGISSSERLLAAVFIQYSDDPASEKLPGGLRDRRTPSHHWVREIQL
jgi:nitroreductase